MPFYAFSRLDVNTIEYINYFWTTKKYAKWVGSGPEFDHNLGSGWVTSLVVGLGRVSKIGPRSSSKLVFRWIVDTEKCSSVRMQRWWTRHICSAQHLTISFYINIDIVLHNRSIFNLYDWAL